MELNYKLEKFEGPLDLLLSLISKNKIDIADIPIALLCDQYMEYINAAEELDMDLSSDFLYMASELMLIKSRMLLPRDEENDEDPREALAAALLEYQRAKSASERLKVMFGEYGGRMVKETDEISPDKTYVADHESELLYKAFVKVMNALGYGVQLMDESCCGVAMVSNGMWSNARSNADHNMSEIRKAVSNGLSVVTTASTCTFTMREEYPGVLGIGNSDVEVAIV